jgi:PAS domain S-box-containing protein
MARKSSSGKTISFSLRSAPIPRYLIPRGLLVVYSRREIPELHSSDLGRFGFDDPIPKWVFDVESFAFLAVNDAAVLHYGYSRAEFLRMTILDIRPPEDVVLLLQEELREHRHDSKDERWKHLKKNGSVIDVEVTSQEVVFNGRQSEIVSVRDVTSRKTR